MKLETVTCPISAAEDAIRSDEKLASGSSLSTHFAQACWS